MIMKTKKRNYIFLAVLMMGIATMITGCAKEDIASNDNGGGTNPTDVKVDELNVKVTADVPTAVLSSFDEKSMGGALVRRLNITTGEVTSDTKMILIKAEDIKSRPLTEWLKAAKIYLNGGYIAVEKPHNAHLVSVMEQLANKMAQAEDELMLEDGISILRKIAANKRSASDFASRFKTRITNIETRAGQDGTDEQKPVAEMVIFANDAYYTCAPANEKKVVIRIREKGGNVTTDTKSFQQEYTPYEMGLQADGAAQWLNNRDAARKSLRASNRASGNDAINDLMSADEEMTYHGALSAIKERDIEPGFRPNALNEIIRVWGVHNIETNKDYYLVDHKIVASVGGKVEDDRSNSYKTLYFGPYKKNEYDQIGFIANHYYGAWFDGGEYSMNLTGNGSIQVEDARPSTDNNEGSKTISVGSFEATTTTIGGTITPGFSQKMGASVTGSASFSTGHTQGTAFIVGSTVNYKELKCQKNTDGNKVSWTYSCGTDMLEGDVDEHPLAPDVLVGDVDINNQACWSVGNPEGNYTLNIDQKSWMSTIVADIWEPDEPSKKLYDAAEEFTLSYTLLPPNRSQQIWNMDVTFPEITQDGYNEVKPKLTDALKNQFPSVYQPEMQLADQTPESENTIKQVVKASKKLLMDENALQTLREYALTYKISQFTIKWYSAGTDHNTYQLTIKAQGDPDPGKEEAQRDPVDLSKLTGDYVAQDGDVLTGTLAGNYKITIVNGAVVTLNGVTINGTNDKAYDWAGITCQGNNIIVLADGSKNVVKGFNSTMPGIYVPQGSRLIIQGTTGSLDVSSNGNGCGIGGGNKSKDAGDIEIQGGVITATGGEGCAGIGSGGSTTCGNILISGGTVTAQGGDTAAGIGSGGWQGGDDTKAVCGTITITGGTVTATGGMAYPGAGIGSGDQGYVGDILISGGTIIANGDSSGYYAGIGGAASIGAGWQGYCGNITIKKTVTSVTAKDGVGLSPTGEGYLGTVTIEEGANVIQK